MKKLAVILFLLTISTIPVFSQETDSSHQQAAQPLISGSLDVYYRYDFNRPGKFPYNSQTVFTHSHNSFELGMASLRADHNFGKVGVTIDLGFGTRAKEFSYNDSGIVATVKQAYLSYAPSSGIKLTMGTWDSHLGYEMVDAYLNKNYSMSYLFTNGPFTHTGIRADVVLHGKTALMIGLSNPTDFRTAPGMPKSFIGQLSTASRDDRFHLATYHF